MLLVERDDGNLSDISCPKCHCKGNFCGHGHYMRKIVRLDGEVTLRIRRVKCASCNSTHAVLPPDVVAYRAYSESFVLAVIDAWSHGASRRLLMLRFSLPQTTCRRMLKEGIRRMCSLAGCPPYRAEISVAISRIGISGVSVLHKSKHGTRFCQRVILINSRGSPKCRSRPST